MSSENHDQPDDVGTEPSGIRPPSAERIADIALGVGVVAIEKLEQVAGELDGKIRHALADAPQFVDSLEEKGRPIRDKILDMIRQRPTVADVFAAAARTERPTDDKMTALEQRVLELEQEHVADEALQDTEPDAHTPSTDSSK